MFAEELHGVVVDVGLSGGAQSFPLCLGKVLVGEVGVAPSAATKESIVLPHIKGTLDLVVTSHALRKERLPVGGAYLFDRGVPMSAAAE